MDIQLTSDIKDLLMEDGMAILPGLGGFTSTYKPAVTDGVMGVLHPPSYHIAFDPNLQVNDGKLVDYIREKYHVSSTVAQEAIDAFVKETKSQFDKKEIVILPEIGRLYVDFTQKIQFLPEATNFNVDAFGLSTISFSPISRTISEAVKPVPAEFTSGEKAPQPEPLVAAVPPLKEKIEMAFLTPMDDVPPPTIINKPKEPSWLPNNWRDYAPAVAVAFITLLAIIVWMNLGHNPNTEGEKKLENEKPKVNVSPRNNTGTSTNTTAMPNGDAPQSPNLPPQNTLDSPAIGNDQFFDDKNKDIRTAAKPPITPLKASNNAIIIIGGFANKSNIIRLKKWITEQGYGVYEKKKSSGLTEIGCEVGYETKEELNRIVKKIKTRYGDEIEVFKK